MRRHVHFPRLSPSNAGTPQDVGVPACVSEVRYHPLDRPDRLVPELPIEDEDDPELVDTLAALYWWRKQQELEQEDE